MSDRKHIDCTCNSGRYCHKHERYSTQRGKTAFAHSVENQAHDEEVYHLTQHEKCGGGRRIIRGGFSANNRNW